MEVHDSIVIFVSGRELNNMLHVTIFCYNGNDTHYSLFFTATTRGPHPLLVGNIRFMFMCS